MKTEVVPQIATCPILVVCENTRRLTSDNPGSVADPLIRSAPCPVLVVPSHHRYSE